MESMTNDMDIDRERMALAVRCNMLARRFARCTKKVKIALLKNILPIFLYVQFVDQVHTVTVSRPAHPIQ